MNNLEKIIDKITSNQRIDSKEAITLFHEADLLILGDIANKKRLMHHPESVVTFVVDRNINYTNVCVSGCLFCAFFRSPDHADAYVISKESLKMKIEETTALGGTQILLQGGMHPYLGLDYYLDLLSYIKNNFSIHIHGFSPPEIVYLARKSDISIQEGILFLLFF